MISSARHPIGDERRGLHYSESDHTTALEPLMVENNAMDKIIAVFSVFKPSLSNVGGDGGGVLQTAWGKFEIQPHFINYLPAYCAVPQEM